MKKTLFAAAAAAVAVAASTSAFAVNPCPPDLNCTGTVDVNDLLSVIGAWGQSGSSADVNSDGIVDVNDLLLVVGAWGPCVFQYGPAFANEEAHQIGLEMLGGNALLLTLTRYTRVDRDLGLIRAFEPDLVGQPHTAAWVPNEMIVGLSGKPTPEYLCLNTFYQAQADVLFGDIYVLTFPGWVNVEAMVNIYTGVNGVDFAEPNGIIGGENFWVPNDLPGGLWRWEIDDGFLDCFDTCDCHRNFVFEVTAAGAVSLVGCSQTGQDWCDFTGSECP